MLIEMTNNESITRPSDQGSFVLSVFEMIITAQKENITNITYPIIFHMA